MVDFRREARVNVQPGTPLTEVLRVLRSVHDGAANLLGMSTDLGQVVDHYLSWANESVRMLRHALPADEIDRLILTRRYWSIQASPGSGAAKVVQTEIDDRTRELAGAIEWVEATRKKWERSPGVLVVADTSVYCQHPDKVADIDFSAILGTRAAPVRLMVPIVVLDELEGLKQASKAQTRWRAGHTLGKLDEILDATGTGRLQEGDFGPAHAGGLPRGPVHVEVFFDPRSHRRLPINDDELVERALAIATESGRDVVFLTYDTGQSTRARFAGLNVKKLRHDPGPEPA